MSEEIVQAEPETQDTVVPENNAETPQEEAEANAPAEAPEDSGKTETIPKERFDQEIGKRNAAERRAKRIEQDYNAQQERIAALEEKLNSLTQEKAPDPNSYDSQEEYEAAQKVYADKLQEQDRQKIKRELRDELKQETASEQRVQTFLQREAEFKANNPDYQKAVDLLISSLPKTETNARITQGLLDIGPEAIMAVGRDFDTMAQVYSMHPDFAVQKAKQLAAGLQKKSAPKEKLPNPPKSVSGTTPARSETQMSGKDLRKKYGV